MTASLQVHTHTHRILDSACLHTACLHYARAEAHALARALARTAPAHACTHAHAHAQSIRFLLPGGGLPCIFINFL